VTFSDFLPEISLPKVLSKLGYHTVAKVSMPVLNKYTLISKHFDEYKLMSHHNDFATMVEEIEFPRRRAPVLLPESGRDPLSLHALRRRHAAHLRRARGDQVAGQGPARRAAEDRRGVQSEQLKTLHKQQIKCVEYIDGLIGKLIEKAPKDTWFIVTSDHGELFGEDGYFGHGPIMHEKCFEIPFVEGRVR
jgi:arylsulfatase A-like enzyme